MGKYEPLKTFLQTQKGTRIPVGFAEIERVLGFSLPSSKQYPAWWSNNPSNNPMTKVWLDAGFMTESVDIPSERLIFRKVEQAATPPGGSPPKPPPNVVIRLRAALRGTVRFAPGFEPTEPTGEAWDAETE